MASLRLTPKGADREEVYSIAYDSNDNASISGKFCGEDKTFKLIKEGNILFLDDTDYNLFEESRGTIDDRLLGLSEELLSEVASGVELTGDDNRSLNKAKPGYDFNDIYVENKPFSIQQLIDLIKAGDLELSPAFQRNFVWDKTRQSRLIESILLGLPLPSMYLSQYPDGVLTIVDGLQRLHTIKRFLDDELMLSNLEYLVDCNGKTYKGLSGTLSQLQLRRFKQTQIMCFVIDYRSPNELKFDLFRRLNVGGKPLNNQEMRNCLSRIHVQAVLQDMVTSEEFRKATNGSVKDTRMQAQEIALRFLYFRSIYNPQSGSIEPYDGNIEENLDRFIDELNDKKAEELTAEVDAFKRAMNLAHQLFGDRAFRKPSGSERLLPINKLLLISLSLILSYGDQDMLSIGANDGTILGDLDLLLKDDSCDLLKAISNGTNGKWNVETAIRILRNNLLQDFLPNNGNAQD